MNLRPYDTGPWEAWRDYANELEADNASLTEKVDALKRGITFFASVIKSGEKWTQYCQDMFDALLAKDSK